MHVCFPVKCFRINYIYIYTHTQLFFPPIFNFTRLSVLLHLKKVKFHHPVLVHHLTSLNFLIIREEIWQKMRISVDSTSPRCWSEKTNYSCLLMYLCKMAVLLSEISLSHALLHKSQGCQFTLKVSLQNGFYVKCIVAQDLIFLV